MDTRSATSHDLDDLAKRLARLAREKRLTVVAAESCTGGLLAQILCDAPGATDFFHGNFVTYTKLQKIRALGVPADLLQSKGAVCAEVARAMATGALQRSPADLSAAITGVAGPEPDEDGNPVGRVWIAVAGRGGAAQDLVHDYGDIGRDAVRRRAVADTLAALMKVAAEIE